MTNAETNVIICSPGLIRMSQETLRSCVGTTLQGLLHTLPKVAQRQVEEREDRPKRFVVVELSDPDTAADQGLIEQRLKKLLCPHELHVSDEEVSVVFV